MFMNTNKNATIPHSLPMECICKCNFLPLALFKTTQLKVNMLFSSNCQLI